MPKAVVLCVPFAGAGASVFRPWVPLCQDRFELAAVQLPGREQRFAEEPYRDVAAATEGLLPEVLERVSGAGPVVLFGHSLGAVLSYEIAHRLAATDGVDLTALVISGSPGPWTRRENGASGLDDDEFLARVKEFAGYRHDALEDPEMRELLLPTLRADVEMHESYVPRSDDPLPVPIVSVRGTTDTLVTTEQAMEWSKATSRDFRFAEVEGGHMYLVDNPEGLIRVLADVCPG
ncbi:thioesterase II family protein [Streptomyces radiopugnans]|uniref:Surfactin synthase thioesterase subunit n=1 Tax=Streptomyces radiopugnans TaxID=403935 RepID=A0A1H9KP87_9ACTN|nr:alpha/beta fold hydrolase [Streptomyces radiopugnans]SER00737.1 Surfactin synthase thioesterase subunit [Streptomyces radiopugnans]